MIKSTVAHSTRPLLLALVVAGLGAGSTSAAEIPEEVMAALQRWQPIIGEWEGSGQTESRPKRNWDEKIAVIWKFNSKKGRVAFHFRFENTTKKQTSKSKMVLAEALMTFDPEKQVYVFQAFTAGDDPAMVVFEGTPKSESTIEFERVDKGSAKDDLDKLQIKLLNQGDRLVYTFYMRRGRRSFAPYATVGLDREGTSLVGGAAKGPECIVSGGKGTIAVSYKGKTYYVCCTGCQAMFNEDPERYVNKTKKITSE
ncbi:YHS domain protein [Planctomycetes bacterium Pan216]|uniref:YHS domain protein n=1 Tax=Kolteria novifilia TaxID=2527975 RepID=A0A518BB05_9BACT|nr:YHS domain protein [Planctomycetes bacterium Pan216]